MLRALAIVSGLATMSVLSVNLATSAYAACNYENCTDLVILVCGDRDFVGASDNGPDYAEKLARAKALRAGYDPDRCLVRGPR
jgi:phage/plasmid primase-like uncharacterized protein